MLESIHKRKKNNQRKKKVPRTALQFKRMKDERKLSILEASLPLFSLDKDKVSVDLISQKAKCSHGLVYHYFKNTDAIYEELLTSETYLSLKGSLFVDDKGKYAFEVITQIMKVLFDLDSIQDIAFANILISETGKKSLLEKLTSLVSRGQKEGEVTGGNPKDIVLCAFYLLKGMYLSYLTQKKPKVEKPSFDNVMKVFKKSV